VFVQRDVHLAVAFPIRFVGAKEEGVRLPAMEMMEMNWDKIGLKIGSVWENAGK
jgi:amidase